MSRPPLPPFTDATAADKARLAEDAWNSRDPARVALAFLVRKWAHELDYRLIKEVWTHAGNRIAVRIRAGASKGSSGKIVRMSQSPVSKASTESMFFFEKKNQKTFISWRVTLPQHPTE